VTIGRQKGSGDVLHVGDDARDRCAIDVHIEDRQEDRDLLPLPRRRFSGRAGPACITLPSAGDSTSVGSAGDSRSGSRKKRAIATGRISSSPASHSGPVTKHTAAGTAAMPINGRPAGSIFTMGCFRKNEEAGAHFPGLEPAGEGAPTA
jgi:hypothetical protein